MQTVKKTRRNNSEVISRNGKKQTVLPEYANLAAAVRNMGDEARLLTVREPSEATRECIRQISIEVFSYRLRSGAQDNGI